MKLDDWTQVGKVGQTIVGQLASSIFGTFLIMTCGDTLLGLLFQDGYNCQVWLDTVVTQAGKVGQTIVG